MSLRRDLSGFHVLHEAHAALSSPGRCRTRPGNASARLT